MQMHNQLMTRRDVVALLSYITLVLNVVQWLLIAAHTLVVTRLLFPSTSFPNQLTILICHLACLLLWPFVPLMSSLIADTDSWIRILPQRAALVVRCVGLVMFLSHFPHFLNSLFLSLRSLSGKTAESKWFFYLLSQPLVFLSLGFALAFFPAIFDSLRLRMRGEQNENAA